jgi:hypothetical protein
MELVRVDDEEAAPVHNNKLNAAQPVHNKLNRTLSSASDETMRASAEAPAAQERPTLEDRPPSFLRRIFAGHTPHTSGRKRFVPKRPMKENRRYAEPSPPRRSWSFSSRGWAFPPGYTGQSPQPRSKKTARKSVVSRLRSAVRSVTQLRQWASPRPTARRASFANRKALPADPGLAQPAAVL